MLYPHERKHRRYKLRYPVRVKFPCGNSTVEMDTFSKNVSIGGVLLEAAAMIPPSSPVSFVMTVRGGRVIHAIQLSGEGKVVRVEHDPSGTSYAIAVECNTPINHWAGRE